jgi:hypothetical protein
VGVTLAGSAPRQMRPLPAPLSKDVDDLHGVRCYGWAGRAVSKTSKAGSRGAWRRSVVEGVRWPAGDGVGESTSFKRGWALTHAEATYNGSAWVALAKRSKKPGLTSVTRGDAFSLAVDTTVEQTAGGAHTDPVLQLTFLQSYEHVGIVSLRCVRGCTCDPMTVDTLAPTKRFATLATALSGAVSPAKLCVLRVSNASPRPPEGAPPRTKIKLVSLAVLASAKRRGKQP